jgi:CPA1 family monovalent cation:H+ antiporter
LGWALGTDFQARFGVRLSHDLILLVLLPPLLFEGAATTSLESFQENLLTILVLAVPGLVISVILLGAVGQYVLGLPLILALLFGAMVLPTDPVSVLALFEEVGVPERLSTLVEGESLVNDSVGIVVFSTLLALVTGSSGTVTASDLLRPDRLLGVTADIAVTSVGGLAVGIAAGYAVCRVMVDLDEHMTETVLTIITAYGFFLLAEHYLGVSGVIATVVAGLFIGNRGAEHAMSPQTKISIFNTLSTGALIVNTFIFLAIGINTPVGDLAANAGLIVAAILLVLAVRIAIVYPLAAVVNRVQRRNVSVRYQHALVWGALHGSIPIALVLGLTPELPPGGEAAGDGLRRRRVQPRRPGADDAATDGPARRRDPLGREGAIRTAHRTCSCRRRRIRGRRTTRTGREPPLRRLRGLHRGVRTREG